MTTVAVVGGSGRDGRHAAEAVLASDDVERVVLIGRDEARLAPAGEALGPRTHPAVADVRQPAALAAAIAGADVVLNATAPFFRLGTHVLEAAMSARAQLYLDICDDWEPTLAMLGLDRAARDAGLVAVTGLGLAPGADSLLAVLAMRELDHVEEILTAWSLATDPPSPKPTVGGGDPQAAPILVHFAHCCSGVIRNRIDDIDDDRPALQPYPLRLPRGATVMAHTVGSPEAVTLHRSAPAIRTNLNLMLAPPEVIDGLDELRQAVDAGLLDLDEAALLLGGAASDHDAVPPDLRDTDVGDAAVRPALLAVARGSRGGDPTEVTAYLSDVASDPITAAGRLLGSARGTLLPGIGPGVHPPESAVEPSAYLALVGRHEISIDTWPGPGTAR